MALSRHGEISADSRKKALVQALRGQYKDAGHNLFENGVKIVFASDYVGKFEDRERTALFL